MHTPGDPARLGALGRRVDVSLLLDALHWGLPSRPAVIHDRIASDRVEPGSSRPTLGAVAPCRAPDRRERLLDGFLGAASISEPAQRLPEHRPGIAPVERFECFPIPRADPRDQFPVADLRPHGANGYR